jgi:hypothetical protein
MPRNRPIWEIVCRRSSLLRLARAARPSPQRLAPQHFCFGTKPTRWRAPPEALAYDCESAHLVLQKQQKRASLKRPRRRRTFSEEQDQATWLEISRPGHELSPNAIF